MTMEEVASGHNLKEAFRQMASNHGAPGADGQTIKQVREHLGEVAVLHGRRIERGWEA